MILLATLLLAILAGVFTAVLLRRAIASGAVPGDQRRPRPSPD